MNVDVKQKKSTANTVIGVILFVFAGLETIVAARQFMFCTEDVISAIEQGMSISEGFVDIIFYYLESCGQYLCTSAILFGLGWIVLHQRQKLSSADTNSVSSQSQQHINSELSENKVDGYVDISNENSGTGNESENENENASGDEKDKSE